MSAPDLSKLLVQRLATEITFPRTYEFARYALIVCSPPD